MIYKIYKHPSGNALQLVMWTTSMMHKNQVDYVANLYQSKVPPHWIKHEYGEVPPLFTDERWIISFYDEKRITLRTPYPLKHSATSDHDISLHCIDKL